MAKLTPAIALTHYAALSDEERSFNSLEAKLKSLGFACSRQTLGKWAEAGKWDEHVGASKKTALVGAQGAILDKMVKDAVETVEGFERCLVGLEGLTEDIIKRVRELLPNVVVENTGELIDLAKTASHIATATANIRKAVGEAALAVQTGEPAPGTGKLIEGDTLSADGFADWKRHRGIE